MTWCAGLRKTSDEEASAPMAGSPASSGGGSSREGGGAYCDFLGLPGTPGGPPGSAPRPAIAVASEAEASALLGVTKAHLDAEMLPAAELVVDVQCGEAACGEDEEEAVPVAKKRKTVRFSMPLAGL